MTSYPLGVLTFKWYLKGIMLSPLIHLSGIYVVYWQLLTNSCSLSQLLTVMTFKTIYSQSTALNAKGYLVLDETVDLAELCLHLTRCGVRLRQGCQTFYNGSNILQPGCQMHLSKLGVIKWRQWSKTPCSRVRIWYWLACLISLRTQWKWQIGIFILKLCSL